MSNYDPRIALALDRLIPPVASTGDDWDQVVREAGATPVFVRSAGRLWIGRQRRIAVLTATVVAAVLVAIPALAVGKGWWFLGPGAPKPAGDIAVVTSGHSAGIVWTMTAYVSEDKGVCVALTTDLEDRDTGSESCGAGVRGEPRHALPAEVRHSHWIGYVYFALGLSDFPEFVFGPVAEGVREVELVLSSGQAIRTETIDGPSELRAPLDFYVVELPRGASLESIVARDASGTILEQRRCSRCSAALPPMSDR